MYKNEPKVKCYRLNYASQNSYAEVLTPKRKQGP